MTNVSPQSQSLGFNDMRHRNEQPVRPPALVHNHLHGSDMFIRNHLSDTENTAVPPKFQRTLTPSPTSYDSDYFSTSSRGSAITPPPFARTTSTSSPVPHGIDRPLTSPTNGSSRFTSSHHVRSKSVNATGRRPRARRRHSSIETSVDVPKEVVEHNGIHHVNGVPSRPQSSAICNVQEHVVSNRLNRHKSYYEAVNNAAVTSQTIFSHPSRKIQTLPEELSGSTDTSIFSTNNTVCASGINLEMISQSQDDYPSHDQSHLDRIKDSHYCPQSDSELVTSSPRTNPRRRNSGSQASAQSTKQIDAAHPRLLNSTNPPSPLQIARHSPPKHQRHQLNSCVQHDSPQQCQRPRYFSYDDSHIQQVHAR